MNLDDYIKQAQEKQRKQKEAASKKPPEGIEYYYNIDSYNIPNNIVELIKELKDYINEYPLDSNLPRTQQKGYRAMLQVATTEKSRMAVAILLHYDLYDPVTGYDMCFHERTRPITEDKYQETAKRYKRVGSQKFYDLNFDNYYFLIKSAKMEHEHIYYTDDGYIYVSPNCAEKLQKIDIDEFGMFLAKKAETEKRKAKIKQKDM